MVDTFNVEVKKTQTWFVTKRVKATTSSEAEELAIKEAQDDEWRDANHWAENETLYEVYNVA